MEGTAREVVGPGTMAVSAASEAGSAPEQAFSMRTLTTIVCDVPVDVDIDGAMIEESGLLV